MMLLDSLEPRRLLANYSIVRLDGESGAIDPNRETWLIVHGWRSAPSNFAGLAAAIGASANYANDQILAIDWTESAQTSVSNPFSAEAAIPDVAEYAANRLTQLGFDGSELNIIGHSFGAYVGNETAMRMAQPVNSIIGLDPGSNVYGGYDSEDDADFSENAERSWAFHASSFYGNPLTPKTAAESFFINIDASDEVQHSAPISMLAGLFLDAASVPDALKISRLVGDSPNSLPWVQDRYDETGSRDSGGGYDAVIYSRLTSIFSADLNLTVPLAMRYSGTNVEVVEALGTSASQTTTLTPGTNRVTINRGGSAITQSLDARDILIAHGGEGNDTLDASTLARYANLFGEGGDDRIVGTAFNDRLSGGSGLDKIYGLAGNDLMTGDANADMLWGGDGNDTLTGASGNDYLRGEAGDDNLSGGSGIDRMRGSFGRDFLAGGSSNDKMYGDDGDDTLTGNSGRDILYGGNGTDTRYADNDDTFYDFEVIA